MAKHIFRYYPHSANSETEQLEQKIFKYSLIVPTIFIIAIMLIKFAELFLDVSFVHLGVFPRSVKGLIGILTSPFIHANWKHAIGNSTSLLILTTTLFFFYRKFAFKIFVLNYFMTGILLWIIGRDAWHIGASGIVYGMAAFLFLSGLIRNDLRLLTIALIVAFLYGSFFWGLFPIEEKISWEGHTSGAITGVLLALFYKNQGPPRIKFEWEDEEEQDDDETDNEELEITTIDEDETNQL